MSISIKWSHYRNIYTSHIAIPSSILEIGVANGGSHLNWLNKGCYPVYGIDINPYCSTDKFKCFIGDVCDKSFIRQVAAEIGLVDYIIDDGGHRPYQIYSAFKHLWPICKKAYLIEDLHLLGKLRWRLWELLRLPGLNTILRRQVKEATRFVADNNADIKHNSLHLYPHMLVIERRQYKINTRQYELPENI